MEIRRFFRVTEAVPDPTHPGHRILIQQWVKADDTMLSTGGKQYTPNVSGWFEVPDEDAAHLIKTANWYNRVGAMSLGIQGSYDDEPRPRGRKPAE